MIFFSEMSIKMLGVIKAGIRRDCFNRQAGLLEKIQIIFVDTFTLFKETMAFLREVQDRYGINIHTYHALGYDTQEEFEADKGLEFWKEDIDEYDQLCKVEPLQ